MIINDIYSDLGLFAPTSNGAPPWGTARRIAASTYNVGRWLVSWYPIVSAFFSKINQYPAVCWGWGSIVRCVFSDSFFSGGALSTCIHLSVGKAGPFTVESHIHVKALKMQCVPNN